MPDEQRPTEAVRAVARQVAQEDRALSAQEHEALTSGSTLRLAELALARGEDELRRGRAEPARAGFSAAATLFRLAGDAERAGEAARRAAG